MTSPAHFVLSLLLVCSIIGTTSETMNAHDNNQKDIQKNKFKENKLIYEAINVTDLKMVTIRTKVNNHRIENRKYVSLDDNAGELRMNFAANVNSNDDIYTEKGDVLHRNFSEDTMSNLFSTYNSVISERNRKRKDDNQIDKPKRRTKREDDSERCKNFQFQSGSRFISHPYPNNTYKNYYGNIDCTTVISGKDGSVIQLTFVDIFHIEYHPDCSYDYLEIRDGMRGYAKLLGKVCGEAFPRRITTTGPYAWLKFHADATIEYEGFHINVEFIPSPSISYKIPDSCGKNLTASFGKIDSSEISDSCITGSAGHDLDFLWRIETPKDTKIYLNFSSYSLKNPNECEDNVVQVFGHKPEEEYRLENYCGSVANPVTTKGGDGAKSGKDGDKGKEQEQGNIMHVRIRMSNAGRGSSFTAIFTAFKIIDSSTEEKCTDSEFDFDCGDNTCISSVLKCDSIAHCRLKADEDREICKNETESMLSKAHILVILVIFSLILSGMSFVFLFKCIRKLYQDHKIIKEHIRQSCEDRLDNLVSSRLTLDAKRLQRDSEPRASLERENHTNEMFKQQRKYSQCKHSSIESDFIEETHLDLDDEPWRRDVEKIPVQAEDIRIERNGRTRRSDFSAREESIRSRRKESEERKNIRDVSVGAPDTKESGCQTRESLFQEPPPSSDGSGTMDSRGFSTFGYSGATIVRPSSPLATNTSQITIELLREMHPRQDSKIMKKISDRRPISAETTRSAPDVIIVSKPIR